MPTDELRGQIAEALLQHFPVNRKSGLVVCRCRAEVKADPDRKAFREHLADVVLAIVETTATVEG